MRPSAQVTVRSASFPPTATSVPPSRTATCLLLPWAPVHSRQAGRSKKRQREASPRLYGARAKAKKQTRLVPADDWKIDFFFFYREEAAAAAAENHRSAGKETDGRGASTRCCVGGLFN